jgi:hypothetical protein
MHSSGEEQDSITVFSLLQEAIPNLHVLFVIRTAIIHHCQKNVIPAIKQIILILQIQIILPLGSRLTVNYAIQLIRAGNRHHIRNMTANLFQSIPVSIMVNGMHVLIAIQIHPTGQLSTASIVMSIIKPQWIKNTRMKEDIHMTVLHVTGVTPKAGLTINTLL